MADDGGVDLLVYDKATGNAVPLQIKSRTKTLKRNPKIVHFEVRRATFKQEQDAYVVAVLIDPGELNIRQVWLIPMRKLPQVARQGAEKLVIRPSRDIKSRDRLTPYRCGDIAEVARRLISDCEKTT